MKAVELAPLTGVGALTRELLFGGYGADVATVCSHFCVRDDSPKWPSNYVYCPKRMIWISSSPGKAGRKRIPLWAGAAGVSTPTGAAKRMIIHSQLTCQCPRCNGTIPVAWVHDSDSVAKNVPFPRSIRNLLSDQINGLAVAFSDGVPHKQEGARTGLLYLIREQSRS
jgi:hypothetical protein